MNANWLPNSQSISQFVLYNAFMGLNYILSQKLILFTLASAYY